MPQAKSRALASTCLFGRTSSRTRSFADGWSAFAAHATYDLDVHVTARGRRRRKIANFRRFRRRQGLACIASAPHSLIGTEAIWMPEPIVLHLMRSPSVARAMLTFF